MRLDLWRATLVVLLLSACRQSPPATPGQVPSSRGPTTQATVLTIHTTMQPSNRATAHTIVIAGSKARSMDEGERWRLFDTEARTVTFVNDLEGTYRTETLDSILAQRRTALRRPADRELPEAEYQETGMQREILSVPASQSIVRLGGYQRELWFATHPLIPDELFSMIHGSADLATRLSGIVADADQGLVAARGFPLIDRAELPYGKTTMIVERRVTSIQRTSVQASILEIPRGYREVTAPDGNRRPASSRPPGRTAPAAGSPPSSTTQTAP
ncbi:MAG TPA: hypothetical protein VFT12_10595 [Thermoanaerobaculia bacterium]|nr:hypothetical protein [Thermoanaerobaculia bacterium]